jgi:uncharacterized protein
MNKLLWIVCASFALAAYGGDGAQRVISVNGEALIRVVPDEVVVSVGVETFNKALELAQQANSDASQKLVRAVKELGVDEKQIQTDQLEVEIKYQEYNHPSVGIEGYFARRAYTITLKDIKLFEKLIDAALKNGANRLMGFEYRTNDLRKHRDAARKQAIIAAREKATALTTELGCKLGKPTSINEGYSHYWGGYRPWGGGGYRNQQMTQNVMSDGGGGGEGGGETMPTGQIGVRATVSVVFEFE